MDVLAFTERTARSLRRCVLLSGCTIALALAPAAVGSVFIVNLPWVFPAGKGKSTEAFMVLQSSDGATLVSARSPMATSVTIAAAGAKGARMDRLPLPLGEEVILAPGKLRLRLDGIQRTLKLGEQVPLVLTIEAADGSRQDITVRAEVRRRSVLEDELREHHHNP
jgi:copper(I)-binding protein